MTRLTATSAFISSLVLAPKVLTTRRADRDLRTATGRRQAPLRSASPPTRPAIASARMTHASCCQFAKMLSEPSAPYSSATARFQVPSISHDSLAPTAAEYVSQWVGIGGYGDATQIQLGAMEFVSPSNAPTYLVWYQLYPAGALETARAVKPGDIIAASLQCTAACSPSSAQT